ncbi:MAG: SRPBCC family protein [Pseudomonadota bacterium]
MTSPLSFKGELGRFAYAGLSLAAFFAQHVFAYGAFFARGLGLDTPWWFWLSPLRVLANKFGFQPDWLLLLGLALTLLADWALLALAYRRARKTSIDPAWSVLAVVPGVQALIFLSLFLAPDAKPTVEAPTGTGAAGSKTRALAIGLAAGVFCCVGAVAFSTLVLGLYGYGLFIGAPFVVGVIVAYIANREANLRMMETTQLVFGALGLGALALMGFALEGAICIVMASPLVAFMGWVGGIIGQGLARRRRERDGRTVLMSVALLPLLVSSEALMPPRADFESVESIEIAASPMQVWDSVVHMGPIPDAPAAPFRWGLAYPLRGEIHGEGVGAVRRGVFSTGVAYERVTAWEPGRRLDFIVLSDPPSMHELSPYAHVNAPHVRGYFRTRDARFAITPLPNGHTRLTLSTHHDLDLEPALYWLPLAQWAVHANKTRVLQHFRRQAETRGAAAP